jgi:hypothetical protein
VPLSRHLLGVSSRAFATLLEVHLQELGAHRLPSRGHRREVRGEVSRERSEVIGERSEERSVERSEVREVLSGHPRQS